MLPNGPPGPPVALAALPKPIMMPGTPTSSGLIACSPLVTALLLGAFVQNVGATPAIEEGIKLFHEKIEPVLRAECYECHSAQATRVKGDLYLDSQAGILTGGFTGPALEPGDLTSLILQALRHEDDLEMPPEKPKLSPGVIADFERWVSLGAPDPRVASTKPVNPATDPAQARGYWAFQPVADPTPPAVRNSAWARTPVDRFILAALEEKGLTPAPRATREELLRRVYFDVTGLPPPPEAVRAFLADDSPDAYERVVDGLLASPQYGEHFARGWLDVVRYAETEGFEYDNHLPEAWRFRDYVIDSLNRDKPFSRFVTEQLAGDEIAPLDPELQSAAIFHRLGTVRRNAGNPEIALSRNEVLTERTDIIGTAFMGLTVGCARCHDHRLDPILQKDYYRLQAYVAGTEEYNMPVLPDDQREAWHRETDLVMQQIRPLRDALENAEGEERRRLNREIAELNRKLPVAPAIIPSVRNNPEKTTEIHVLLRGDWERKGERVGPRPLTVLVDDALPELSADIPAPRTELARWLTDDRHPLTPRVAVNRIWQHHFGTGIVKTSNDFGNQGERPSHPELLDWLASRLVENGWRLKPIHRMLLLSETYRQSSRNEHRETAMHIDPDNRLRWHFPSRRLTAEEIRDAMLAVAGRLNPEMGGASVIVPVDEDLVKFLYKPSQWAVTEDVKQHDRRSIYLIAKRNLRLPFMETFDQPDMLSSCGVRESSTHAPQALEMLNGDLSNDLARALAARLREEAGSSPARQVEHAYLLAVGRAPTERERSLSLAFMDGQPLEEFALAMFNLNAFLHAP